MMISNIKLVTMDEKSNHITCDQLPCKSSAATAASLLLLHFSAVMTASKPVSQSVSQSASQPASKQQQMTKQARARHRSVTDDDDECVMYCRQFSILSQNLRLQTPLMDISSV